MKRSAIALIIMSSMGVIFVSNFDLMMRKPVNDISGPKSIVAFFVCGIMFFVGVYFLIKDAQKKKA